MGRGGGGDERAVEKWIQDALGATSPVGSKYMANIDVHSKETPRKGEGREWGEGGTTIVA